MEGRTRRGGSDRIILIDGYGLCTPDAISRDKKRAAVRLIPNSARLYGSSGCRRRRCCRYIVPMEIPGETSRAVKVTVDSCSPPTHFPPRILQRSQMFCN